MIKLAKIKIQIENIVASAELGVRLNLDTIAKSLGNTEYNPSRFPGLIYTVDKPKMVLILFDNGRVACTGARSIEVLERVINELPEKLRKVGGIVQQEPQGEGTQKK